MVPFNSELNFAHLWLKSSRLHKILVGLPTWGKSVYNALSPKWVDKQVFDGECCHFFSTQLPSSVFTGKTIQVVIIWESEVFVMYLTHWVAGKQRCSDISVWLVFLTVASDTNWPLVPVSRLYIEGSPKMFQAKSAENWFGGQRQNAECWECSKTQFGFWNFKNLMKFWKLGKCCSCIQTSNLTEKINSFVFERQCDLRPVHIVSSLHVFFSLFISQSFHQSLHLSLHPPIFLSQFYED